MRSDATEKFNSPTHTNKHTNEAAYQTIFVVLFVSVSAPLNVVLSHRFCCCRRAVLFVFGRRTQIHIANIKLLHFLIYSVAQKKERRRRSRTCSLIIKNAAFSRFFPHSIIISVEFTVFFPCHTHNTHFTPRSNFIMTLSSSLPPLPHSQFVFFIYLQNSTL